MNRTFLRGWLTAVLLLPMAGALSALSADDLSPAQVLLDKPRTNLPTHEPLLPSGEESRIARLTAQLLERFQYLHHPFDDSVSSNFLARLIKDLDSQKIHFLQSDLNEFSRYRNELDDLTLKYGDTTPGYDIFNRFLLRLEQRTAYSEEFLKTNKFDFTRDDRITINRKDQPFPKDLTEAKQLWRERVRFEYLQEKLNQPATNTVVSVKLTNAPLTEAEWRLGYKEDGKGTNSAVATTGASISIATNSLPRTSEQIHAEIVKTLTRRYDRTLKLFQDWDGDNVLQFYLDTLAHVYDPHSDYMGKAAADDFAISMNLSLFGIGALLTSEDGYCKIKELKPGPAAKDGRMKPGDRIVAVAQSNAEPVDVVDMPLSKVVQLIRGPKGTEVRLTVIPADATDSSARKLISLVRDEIKLEDQEAKAKIVVSTDGKGHTNRLGVIDLPSFYASMDISNSKDKGDARSTTDDVAKLIKKLEQEKVSGIILDLRRNGGGSLEEAIRLTGLFIRRGTVVQVRDPSGIVMTDDDEDPDQLYAGPLVVLTSRFSASASEIVAGALQDYGRALIVGDSSTHGKGTVQQLMPLLRVPGVFPRGEYNATNDPGNLKITIRKFYRPSGSSTQLKGVVPDIVLDSVNNVRDDVGETSLDSALTWDTIQAAHIQPVNSVNPFIEELRRRSTARVATNKDFAYIREDMEFYKKSLADKTISLNEAQRLKEKQENDTRDKARRQERAARPAKSETIYELTLKQADLPGLPAPFVDTNSTALVSAAASEANKPAPEEDDDKAPALDVQLDETERILLDYISLLPHETVASAVKPAGVVNPQVQE